MSSAFGVGHKEQYAALWVRAPAESVDAVLQAGVDEVLARRCGSAA